MPRIFSADLTEWRRRRNAEAAKWWSYVGFRSAIRTS